MAYERNNINKEFSKQKKNVHLQSLDHLEIGNTGNVRMLFEVKILLGNSDSLVKEVLIDGLSVLARNQHPDRKF